MTAAVREEMWLGGLRKLKIEHLVVVSMCRWYVLTGPLFVNSVNVQLLQQVIIENRASKHREVIYITE